MIVVASIGLAVGWSAGTALGPAVSNLFWAPDYPPLPVSQPPAPPIADSQPRSPDADSQGKGERENEPPGQRHKREALKEFYKNVEEERRENEMKSEEGRGKGERDKKGEREKDGHRKGKDN